MHLPPSHPHPTPFFTPVTTRVPHVVPAALLWRTVLWVIRQCTQQGRRLTPPRLEINKDGASSKRASTALLGCATAHCPRIADTAARVGVEVGVAGGGGGVAALTNVHNCLLVTRRSRKSMSLPAGTAGALVPLRTHGAARFLGYRG